MVTPCMNNTNNDHSCNIHLHTMINHAAVFDSSIRVIWDLVQLLCKFSGVRDEIAMACKLIKRWCFMSNKCQCPVIFIIKRSFLIHWSIKAFNMMDSSLFYDFPCSIYRPASTITSYQSLKWCSVFPVAIRLQIISGMRRTLQLRY